MKHSETFTRTPIKFRVPAKDPSGKRKAHKHTSFCPVTRPVRAGLPAGCPGVKDLCAILEPKEHKFLPEYPTGKTGDRGDR